MTEEQARSTEGAQRDGGGRGEAGRFYDDYWTARGGAGGKALTHGALGMKARTEARSRERAQAAIAVLRASGASTGRLLEVGCGPGWALEEFSRSGYSAVGLDASELAVREACGRGLEVRLLDVEAADRSEIEAAVEGLEGPGGLPEVVVLLEVLEHLRDPLAALKKVAGLLRPGGVLVVSLPNEIHLLARLRILAGRLPFGGHGDPHMRHFDLPAARALFRAAGLRVLERRALSIVPPRRGLLRAIAAPFLCALPGLFALSVVYLLEPSGHGNL